MRIGSIPRNGIPIWHIVTLAGECRLHTGFRSYQPKEKMCIQPRSARGNSVLVDGYSASRILAKESTATCARVFI